MIDRLTFLLNRVREKLWVRPLAMCVISIAGAFLARTADYTALGGVVPEITSKSIETLLEVMAASMLVIATLAVASMVAAYASASSTATPRSFSVIVSDDISQNALSAFIGAFIFSIVSLIALQNGYYGTAGRFTLFMLTVSVFAIVVVMFVRWVDAIARLGRMGNTIDKVEAATREALLRRLRAPHLGGTPPLQRRPGNARAVYAASIGYVQRVDVTGLQALAEESGIHLEVVAVPGTFTAPGRELAYVIGKSGYSVDAGRINDAFLVGDSRTFDEDPRFGFVVLSEIASRALSPGINDPGTAIDVIGTLVRLFALWAESAARPPVAEQSDRVAVPELALADLFDDAFTPLARDGAGIVEVVVRLQKALHSLASLGHPALRGVAADHARRALARAEKALELDIDLDAARRSAQAAGRGSPGEGS